MFKQITLVGNIGRDPEIRHLPSGATAANFSVAVNESWTDGEGLKQTRVTWFNIVAYQQGERGLVTALIQPHLRQGQAVFIAGDPNIRKYTDRDGNERTAFEVKLGPQSTIKMIGGRPDGERRPNSRNGTDKDGGSAGEHDEGFDGRHREPRNEARTRQSEGAGADDRSERQPPERGRPPARRQYDDDDIPF